MSKFYLYVSDKPNKKYVMVMPAFNHKHHFGASGYRDYTLMHKKASKFYQPDSTKRNKIKQNYLKRHMHEPKGIHNPSTLSDMILWNKPTIQASIKDYERKYKVKVIFRNKKYHP